MAPVAAQPGDFTSVMDGVSHWNVAVLIVGFVILIAILEHIAHHVIHKYSSKGVKRFFQQVKNELIALAIISLLLIVFQGQLSQICLVKDPPGGKAKGDYGGYPADKGSGYPADKGGYPADKGKGVEADKGKNGTEDSAKGRHLLAAVKTSECYEPLFSVTTLHNAHLLLFGIAISYFVYSIGSLLIGLLVVRQLRRKRKGVNHLGQIVMRNGKAWKVDAEYVEKTSRKWLPLSAGMRQDLRGAQWRDSLWRIAFAMEQQFTWIWGQGPVNPDIYRAVRQCCIDYLNSVEYKVWSDGRVEYKNGKQSHPVKALKQKVGDLARTTHLPGTKHPAAAGKHGAGHGKADHGGGHGGHGHDEVKLVRLEKMNITRADIDYVEFTAECLEYVLCKQTNADWLLPLFLGVALCVPHAYYFLVAFGGLAMITSVWVGIKLQLILLHCAVRYERQYQGKAKWQAMVHKYLQARAAGFNVMNGDYKKHLEAGRPGSTARQEQLDDGAVLLHDRTHPSAVVSVGGTKGHTPHRTLTHGSTERKRHFYTTHQPDTSTLFWLSWPGLIRVLLQMNHFIHSSILACLLFSFIFDSNIQELDTKDYEYLLQHWYEAMGMLLLLTLINMIYISVTVIPIYAITCTMGRHTPIEVIARVQKNAVMKQLYRQALGGPVRGPSEE